jgi:hypothetical protein
MSAGILTPQIEIQGQSNPQIEFLRLATALTFLTSNVQYTKEFGEW